MTPIHRLLNNACATAAIASLTLSATPGVAAAPSRADRWWQTVRDIASDANQGRMTGSPGYLRAAAFVERRFHEIGLAPAGENGGYRQQVPFEEQAIDYASSSAGLIADGGTSSPIALGREMIVGTWGGPRPGKVDAGLVFLGYGLHLPALGHDDFAGVDLHGKIAVVIGGGPANIPAAIKSNARREREKLLAAAGAVGLISLTSPRQIEIPWDRQVLLAQQSEMYLADPALRDMPDNFFLASMDPAASEKLFAGTGHSFAELAAASDASAPIATFSLPLRLKSALALKHRTLASPNLVAQIEGSDPALRREYVVLSAHLDHIGVGPPIAGDTIYNGAIDDGSGVATVLDVAERLRARPRPKRSILILITTGEEPGLLGSAWFASRPTVPQRSLVADLNFDVLLPLWPLTSILALGREESSLGDAARTIAARQGLELVPDPLPNRNSFVRTDQYSFVLAGIPSLALKFGFTPGSEAFQLEHDWRANRYHAPSDDADQPGIRPGEAIRFDDFVTALTIDIAGAPSRPEWRPESIFGKGITKATTPAS